MDNNKLKKIAYNCRKATLLIEKQQLGKLSVAERIELKIHLAGCSVCRTYQSQSITLNKLIRDMFNRNEMHLDNNFKRTLQQTIDRKMKN
jgi:hypothetical protein